MLPLPHNPHPSRLEGGVRTCALRSIVTLEVYFCLFTGAQEVDDDYTPLINQ